MSFYFFHIKKPTPPIKAKPEITQIAITQPLIPLSGVSGSSGSGLKESGLTLIEKAKSESSS